MATQQYTNGVTLSDAAEFDRFDTAAYPKLASVAGTNTITGTGPANYALASNQPLILIPAVTNTGATTLNVTPSGGSALTAKNVFVNGIACAGGELTAGTPYYVIYDGTQFQVIGVSVQKGTWTASVGGTAAYTANSGTWTKIGRLVTAFCYFEINTIGSGSTSTISGLPFPVVNPGSGYMGGYVSKFTNLLSNVVFISPQAVGGNSTVTFATLAAAAAVTTDGTAVFKNATRIDFMVVYETTA